jgi:hypothetical protein
MKTWMLLIVFALCCGCAGQRARVTITRAHGEPVIGIEFEEINKRDDSKEVRVR